MSDVDEPMWHTNDGRALYVVEMTDDHLKNAKAFLERRLADKKYLQPHSCPVDLSDGPCIDCEDETTLCIAWEEWVVRFDKEIRRRDAEARRATMASC